MQGRREHLWATSFVHLNLNQGIFRSRQLVEFKRVNPKHKTECQYTKLDSLNLNFQVCILKICLHLSRLEIFLFNDFNICLGYCFRRKHLFKKNSCLYKHFFSVYLYSLYDKIFQTKILRIILWSLSLSNTWCIR